MSEHIKVTIHSMGDYQTREWAELLELIDGGYVVVSEASDSHAIHYILKVPEDTQSKPKENT